VEEPRADQRADHDPPTPQLREEGDLLAALVREAGERVLAAGAGRSRRKGRFDLVTDLDVELEDFLAAELDRRFPRRRILAEESEARKPASIDGDCWVVDPLDGTVNFAAGLPFFAVSVALLRDGVPVLGAVHDPLRGETFRAVRGGGAFLGGRRLAAPVAGPRRARSIGASSGFLARFAKRRPADLTELLARHGKLRILGAQALHLCYAAAGRLRAALSVEARLWDDAAGALVALEAGLRYTDFEGRELFPVAAGSPRLAGRGQASLAAPPEPHRALVALLSR